jgi:hypothetical protein
LLGNVSGLSVKEVGQEDLILMVMIARSEDVGSLKGLREIAEDVEDEEDGRGCY